MNKPVNVLYICDRKKCGDKCSEECKHTTDYNHAVNKWRIPDISKMFNQEGIFVVEKED